MIPISHSDLNRIRPCSSSKWTNEGLPARFPVCPYRFGCPLPCDTYQFKPNCNELQEKNDIRFDPMEEGEAADGEDNAIPVSRVEGKVLIINKFCLHEVGTLRQECFRSKNHRILFCICSPWGMSHCMEM